MQLTVKVCGMRDAENIRQVEKVLSSFFEQTLMGFIFFNRSPRYVEEIPTYLPQSSKRVGVFVNATESDILKRIADFKLNYIQLHGNETPELCSQLKQLYFEEHGTSLHVLKAFNLASVHDLSKTKEYDNKQVSDTFVFDTKTPEYGGSGKQFDWNILKEYRGETPFLLSGGIGPEDAKEVIQFTHPLLMGYDLNSCFELSPGLKDVTLLKHFLNELKNNSNESHRSTFC